MQHEGVRSSLLIAETPSETDVKQEIIRLPCVAVLNEGAADIGEHDFSSPADSARLIRGPRPMGGQTVKSPFPGMDPFIETSRLWEDFHFHLVESIAGVLADNVPQHYLVKTGERAYIVVLDEGDENGKKEHLIKGNAGITAPSSGQTQRTAVLEEETQTSSAAEVVSLRSFVSEEFREHFIEIYVEDEGRELVTCLEVLSPSNKRAGSEGWDQYARKRQALLLGQANFVEIDLLRGGRKMPMHDPWPVCPYTVLVSRRSRAPHCRVWKAWPQKPLPTIKVPLASDDPDVELALQPLVDEIYCQFRYGQQIDYTKPCKPPLSEIETAWLQEQLKNRF